MTGRFEQVCERTGAVIEVVPSDDSGVLDVMALEEMLGAGGVKAVAMTHVPSNGGVVNPAKEGTFLGDTVVLDCVHRMYLIVRYLC